MQRRKRPRAVTLTLPHNDQPHLILHGNRYTLRNFSEEGLGLWMPGPAPFGLQKGSKISGDVVIQNHIHPVEVEVVHHTPRTIGLKFKKVSDELSALFRRLLDPTVYGADLSKNAGSGMLDADTGHPRLWYTGKAGTELLVWYNELNQMVLGVQLCFLGKWVFRRQFQAPQTGHLGEVRHRPGFQVPDSDFVVRHHPADAEILRQASQFLSAVGPPLPGPLLWQFLETGEQTYLPPQSVTKTEVA